MYDREDTVTRVSQEQFQTGPSHPRERQPLDGTTLALMSDFPDLRREAHDNEPGYIEIELDTLPLETKEAIEALLFNGVPGIIEELEKANLHDAANELRTHCNAAIRRNMSSASIYRMAIDFVGTIDIQLYAKLIYTAHLMSRAE